ncbi:MAG: NAD-dependent epimerase/dehydratase family protein [Sandaracinaceae bacterium]|nr:NAD-dependent epimerase/dehydratase family protein [Sandaracinaceae bacterium]
MTQLSVVTGGSGFVGRHLVDGLVARGDRVRVLDLAPPHRDDVEHVVADITDTDGIAKAILGADTVFHNASVVHTKQNQKDFVWKVNLEGTRNVMRGCRAGQVPKLVYVSSGSVVYEGKDIENGDESLPYSSISQAPYADSKIAAEKEVLAANGEGGVSTVSLRPHVIFGPHDARFLPALISHGKAGRLRYQVGRGTWLSDYTYVSNLVDALLAADERLGPDAACAGEAYFITNGEPMPFWDFVKRVAERLGLPPIRARIPHQIVYAFAAVKEGLDTLRGGTISPEDGLTRFAIRYMCTHHYFSIDKARRDLGYDPKVSVAEGIERTCQHLIETGAV